MAIKDTVFVPEHNVPFMSLDKRVIYRHDVHTERVVEVEPDWTGVVEVSDPTKGPGRRYWYLGRDQAMDQRSFCPLVSKDYEKALKEAAPIARQERTDYKVSCEYDFVKSLSAAFGDNPEATAQVLGKFKVISSFDAIRNFSTQNKFDVTQREWLQTARENGVRGNWENKPLEDMLGYVENIRTARESLVTSLAANQTLSGLMLREPSGKSLLLSKCPSEKHMGEPQWRITRFFPNETLGHDEPFGHSNYLSKVAGIDAFLQESHYAEGIEVKCVPFREFDAAFVNDDCTYFIADHIPLGRELATALRVAAQKHAAISPVTSVLGHLNSALDNWAEADPSSVEYKVYNDAFHRANMQAGQPASNPHMVAFAVESAVARGVKPNVQAFDGSAEKWLSDVQQVVEQFYQRALGASDVEPELQDIVDFAYVLAHLDVPEVGFAVQKLLIQARDEAQLLKTSHLKEADVTLDASAPPVSRADEPSIAR